jgi:hypothetical protein
MNTTSKITVIKNLFKQNGKQWKQIYERLHNEFAEDSVKYLPNIMLLKTFIRKSLDSY